MRGDGGGGTLPIKGWAGPVLSSLKVPLFPVLTGLGEGVILCSVGNAGLGDLEGWYVELCHIK